MSMRRVIFVELVLALLVLALVFFNFGHAGGTDLRAGANIAFDLAAAPTAAADLCGKAPDGHAGFANPCHACRTGDAADLPPAPDCAEPAFVALATLYAPLAATPVHAPHLRERPPGRGPPLLV